MCNTNTKRDKIRIVIQTPTCPFERISQTPILKKIPIRRNKEYTLQSMVYLAKFDIFMDRIKWIVLSIPWFNRMLCAISSLAVVCHIALQAYILYKYRNNEILEILSILFALIILFALTNGLLIWNYARLKEPNNGLKLSYLIATIVYAIFTSLSLVFLRDNDFVYFVIVVLLFILGFNIFGLFVVISFIVFLVVYAIALLEVSYRSFREVFRTRNTANKQGYLTYSTYNYDGNKATAIQCAICLANFEEKELVCVGKCHNSHIFHENCITDWLNFNAICPICREIAGLH